MAEVTQADREAAFAYIKHNDKFWIERSKDIWEGNSDPLVHAFARHRIQERAAIVAWLRRLAGCFVTPSILAFFGDPFKRDGQLLCSELADAIARGDHLTPEGEKHG